MTSIVTILAEGYADWEIALLNGAARAYYGIEVRYAAPGGVPVTSAGGLHVTPDLAIDSVELGTADALVVCGGPAWRRADAPAVADLLRRAHAAGILVAGICDGTRALATAGLLDTIGHTSNSAETLSETGYAGGAHYCDVPYAVADDRIVTAPGTAPVSFFAEVMDGLGLADGNLDHYLGLVAAEHQSRTPFAGTGAEADVAFTGR
jgi:putative intracellular protease/amidase